MKTIMKIEELKLRIVKSVNELIDVYYADNNFVDKMINSTLKILIQKNTGQLDSFLKMFQDANGEIDAEMIVNAYAGQFANGGVKFDIKQFVDSDFLKGFLPDKFLLIGKDDILKILKD